MSIVKRIYSTDNILRNIFGKKYFQNKLEVTHRMDFLKFKRAVNNDVYVIALHGVSQNSKRIHF